MPKARTFTIYGKVTVDATVDVTAESLEAAVQKARGLKVDDFVEIHGECIDNSLRVYGVYETD